MKKVLFYCQHILGIGHLIRSMEIVRGLLEEFEVCLINGGRVIDGFQIPLGVEMVNLPAIATDSEFRELRTVDPNQDLETVLDTRRELLLEILADFQPDILIVELFPFGRRRFSSELIPFLDQAQANGVKVVCSLRDIVVTKQDRARHEEKICRLMNQYFDMLLIHGDPKFQSLELSFSRVKDLNCEVHYTGYVVQSPVESSIEEQPIPDAYRPTILTSIGGGRFGHELLSCVIDAAAYLESVIPHQIQMFTGPFIPDELFLELKAIATHRPNVLLQRYTPNLLAYMRQADLSISMAGYNTTMNVLTTGVRSMLLPFKGNDDQEQTLRAERLQELGIVSVIRPEDLQPKRFARRVVACLSQPPTRMEFDFQGVEKTVACLRSLARRQRAIAQSAQPIHL
jgi:predicted glycosyltransferase